MSGNNGSVFRPRKLTRRLLEALEAGLSVDYSPRRVCAQVGVGKSSFYRWLAQGEKDAQEGRSTLARDLWAASSRAREVWVHSALDAIRRASEPFIEETIEERPGPNGTTVTVTKRTTKAGDWRAQAWLLSRLERKRFGSRVDVEQVRRVVEQEKLELIEVVRLGILPHLPPRADRAAVAESIRSVSEARRQERRRLRGRRHRTV